MKKIVILLADGFETVEALAAYDIFKRCNLDAKLVSCSDNLTVCSAQGVCVLCDLELKDITSLSYDCLYLPGGMIGTHNLMINETVLDLIIKQNSQNKKIAAICAAPLVLHIAGVIGQKKITSNPAVMDNLTEYDYQNKNIVIDGNLITSRNMSLTIEFALRVASELGVDVSMVKTGISDGTVAS